MGVGTVILGAVVAKRLSVEVGLPLAIAGAAWIGKLMPQAAFAARHREAANRKTRGKR